MSKKKDKIIEIVLLCMNFLGDNIPESYFKDKLRDLVIEVGDNND